MPQQQSPFLEGKYGWNYGENNWNTGMDENLLKFSFMFDGNVDSIVASLPPVSNGAAHFNSADNRFYFGVDSVWYSSPCPKSFIFKIKSNGDFYQFNGVSAVKIDNPSEIDSRLDAVELTLSSLGTAAFQNVEDFATQAELDIVEGQAQGYTDVLRNDLANATDPSKGAGLVGYMGRTVAEKLDDWASVMDYGAVGDGVADDTAEFVAAIADCKASGKRGLKLAGRTYKLTSRVNVDISGFTIDGEGATIIWAGAGLDSLNTGVFEFKGTLSATATTVAADAAEYTSAMVVASAAGFAVGDVVQIDSASAALPGLYVNVTARITAISGATITTDVTRRLALTASETVSVTKLNAVEGSGIENCKFVATGQTSRANGMGGVFFQYTANCFARNCTFVGFWFKGVKFQFALNAHVSDIYCRNPAATGGGEGYALQFEYVYNSTAKRVIGARCRHTLDFTVAWHITASDCVDSNTLSASYTLHTAFEYDIVYDRCVSQSAAFDGAFVLGRVNTGFGDTTDQITISNCSVVDCAAPRGIAFRNKGSGLRVSNTLVQMRPSVVAYAIAVGNADVLVENCQLFGGILTESDVTNGAFDSGDIRVSNCILVAQDSQRSLNILDGYRVHLHNCTVVGLAQFANGSLYAVGSRFVIKPGNTQYFAFTGTTSNTGSFYFNDCSFDPGAAASGTRDFYGAVNSFVGCNFRVDPNNQLFRPQAAKVVFNGNTGEVRFQLLSTVNDCQFSWNNLAGVTGGAVRVFNAVGFTGTLVAVGNLIQQATDATSSFVIASSNLIKACVFANNFIKGVVTLTDAEITNATVTGNVIDGTATYPTPSANKVVANNVSY